MEGYSESRSQVPRRESHGMRLKRDVPQREGGQAVGPADLFLVVVDSQPQSCQVGDALLKSLAQAPSLRLSLTVLTQVIEHRSDLALIPAHAQQFKAIVLAERLQANVLRL